MKPHLPESIISYLRPTLIQRRILLTLAYSDQFQFPLTAEEIWLRLIDITASSERISQEILETELTRLVASGFLKKRVQAASPDIYMLGYRRRNLAEQRQRRSRIARDKQNKLTSIRSVLNRIPSIDAVFLTGSLAVENTEKEEDIDLFLVVENGTLWSSRLLVSIISFVKGFYRPRTEEIPDSWCLNMWSEHQALPSIIEEGNPYHAYELTQMKPLLDPYGLWHEVLMKHSWVEQWLPHFYDQRRAVSGSQRAARKRDLSKPSWKQKAGILLMRAMNYPLYLLQRAYMLILQHQTIETVEPDLAMFHPRDTRATVQSTWQQVLDEMEVLVPSPISPVLIQRLKEVRGRGESIVLVTGVFDILHEAHREFLENAKKVGDVLVVGVESDLRVRAMKGPERPIHTAEERAAALRAQTPADEVFVLPESFVKPMDHERLIATIRPDTLAVSSHTKHLEAKQRILAKYKGEVKIVMERNPAVSTTKILSERSINGEK